MKTTDLISELSRTLIPVRPLRAPFRRALGWSLGALLLSTAALLLVRGPALHPRFVTSFLAFEAIALFFVMFGSAAALSACIPGASPGPARIPALLLFALLVLLELVRATLDASNFAAGIASLSMALDGPCARDVVLAGLPTGALLFVMMRVGLTHQRMRAGAIVGLCAGAAAVLILRLFCPNDQSPHGLAVHLLPAIALCGPGALLGRWALGPRKRRSGLLD